MGDDKFYDNILSEIDEKCNNNREKQAMEISRSDDSRCVDRMYEDKYIREEKIGDEDEKLRKCNYFKDGKFVYGRYVESIDNSDGLKFKIKDCGDIINSKDIRFYNKYMKGEECLLKEKNSCIKVIITSEEYENGSYEINGDYFCGVKNTKNIRSIPNNDDLFEINDYVEVRKNNKMKRGFIVGIYKRNEQKRFKILLENNEIISKLENNISYPKFYIYEDILYLYEANRYKLSSIIKISENIKYILNNNYEVDEEKIRKRNCHYYKRGEVVSARKNRSDNSFYCGIVYGIGCNNTYSIYHPKDNKYCENIPYDYLIPQYFFTDKYYFFVGQKVLFDSCKEGIINEYDENTNIVMLRCSDGEYIKRCLLSDDIKPKLPKLGDYAWYYEVLGDGSYNLKYINVEDTSSLENYYFLFDNRKFE